MALGIIAVIAASQHAEIPLSGTGGGTLYNSVKILNPNDGVLYVARDRDVLNANQGSWDWKVPSQSYAALPGTFQSVGAFYLDQSGAGRQGEITVYPSQQRLDEPLFVAIGRALQAQATTLDVTEGTQPANPGAGITRLWSTTTDQSLHKLLSSGVDDAFVQTTLAQTLTNKTLDASSNAVVRIGKIGPLAVAAASVSFNPIQTGYAHLELICVARTTDPAEQGLQMQLNGDVGAHYYSERILADDAAIVESENLGQTQMSVGVIPGSASAPLLFGSSRVFMPDITTGQTEHPVLTQFGDALALTTTNIRAGIFTSHWDAAQTITRIDVFAGAGSLAIGSTFWLYGYP